MAATSRAASGCAHAAIFMLPLLLITHRLLADAPYPEQGEINAALQEYAPQVEALLQALVAEIAV